MANCGFRLISAKFDVLLPAAAVLTQAFAHLMHTPNPIPAAWQRLDAALQQLRLGKISVVAFASACRAETRWLSTLPPRYSEVLLQLLDRLESSALFSEESCSFSQTALFDSLQLWLDKARTLPAPV